MESSTEFLSKGYPIALKTKRELDNLLEEFETGRNRSVGNQQKLETLTQILGKQVLSLEDSFKQNKGEICAKELWNRRLTMLREDLETFRSSLENQLRHIYKVREDEKERRKLLSGSTLAMRKETLDASMQMSRERLKLEESGKLLDEITQQGRHIVGNLYQQNITLKNAKKKLLDFRNVLGVSTSFIGLAERRHVVDRMLVYGCMLFTILFFLLLYYFLKLRPNWNMEHRTINV